MTLTSVSSLLTADDSGTCVCARNHASSNARGDFGMLNDCGMVDPFMTHGEL